MGFRKSKRGNEQYYLIASMILGLMVLGISLWFIFHEYFTQDEVNWETCRQSLLVRSGEMINGVKVIQQEAPFKCKTEVVTIDYKDHDKAGKQIMDTMANCWALFGEGDMKLYADNVFDGDYKCFICARIHFTEEVQDYYTPETGIVSKYISQGEAMRLGMSFNWNEYLAVPMKNSDKTYGEYMFNLLPNQVLDISKFNEYYLDELDVVKVGYDKNFDARKGDLFIDVSYYKSPLFNPFVEGWYMSLVPYQDYQELQCDGIETIPA